MDSWEMNKIAASVLSALLLMFGAGTFLEIAGGHGGHGKPGYSLPVVEASAGGAAASAAKAFSFDAVKPLLAKASVDAGQAAFKKCTTCHTPDKGGKNGTGPNMWGVVGREKGAAEGFSFSAPLKSKGGAWTYENLALYLHDPKGFIPGNKMAFAGIKDPAELADVLVYLRTLSDAPVALPQ